MDCTQTIVVVILCAVLAVALACLVHCDQHEAYVYNLRAPEYHTTCTCQA